MELMDMSLRILRINFIKMRYKVNTYRTAGELEQALNTITEYKPIFITRGAEGSITVVFEKA